MGPCRRGIRSTEAWSMQQKTSSQAGIDLYPPRGVLRGSVCRCGTRSCWRVGMRHGCCSTHDTTAKRIAQVHHASLHTYLPINIYIPSFRGKMGQLTAFIHGMPKCLYPPLRFPSTLPVPNRRKRLATRAAAACAPAARPARGAADPLGPTRGLWT